MIGQLVRSLLAIGSTGLIMVSASTRYSTPQIPCAPLSNRLHEMVLAHSNQARSDMAR